MDVRLSVVELVGVALKSCDLGGTSGCSGTVRSGGGVGWSRYCMRACIIRLWRGESEIGYGREEGVEEVKRLWVCTGASKQSSKQKRWLLARIAVGVTRVVEEWIDSMEHDLLEE